MLRLPDDEVAARAFMREAHEQLVHWTRHHAEHPPAPEERARAVAEYRAEIAELAERGCTFPRDHSPSAGCATVFTWGQEGATPEDFIVANLDLDQAEGDDHRVACAASLLARLAAVIEDADPPPTRATLR
ncbi:MAG: hypothetical protein R3F65_30495 [bacterium]